MYAVNLSIATPTTLPGADQVRTYGLDGLGNWKTGNWTLVNSDGSTTSTVEMRQHNNVNAITRVRDTTGGSSTTTPFVYDHGYNSVYPDPTIARRGNGNIVNDGVRIYLYDALNRLLQVSRASDNVVIASYVYDALNRRIQKTISNGGLTGDITNGTTDYFYDGRQIVEERNDEVNSTRQP
jgi:YD repeat-containing protein